MPVRNRDAAGDGAQQPRVVLVPEPTCCCGCSFITSLQIFAAMDLIFGLLNLLSVAMESIETVPEVSSYADYYGGPVHALLTMGSTNEMASTVQAAASGLTASTVIMAALGLMGVQQKNPLYVRTYSYSCLVRVIALGLMALTTLIWLEAAVTTQLDQMVDFIQQLPIFEFLKDLDIPFSINREAVASLFGYICGFFLMLSVACELGFRSFVAWVGLRCASCIENPIIPAPAARIGPQQSDGDNITISIPKTVERGEPISLLVDGQSVTLAAPTVEKSPNDGEGLRRR